MCEVRTYVLRTKESPPMPLLTVHSTPKPISAQNLWFWAYVVRALHCRRVLRGCTALQERINLRSARRGWAYAIRTLHAQKPKGPCIMRAGGFFFEKNTPYSTAGGFIFSSFSTKLVDFGEIFFQFAQYLLKIPSFWSILVQIGQK